jgi:hypothetical protein
VLSVCPTNVAYTQNRVLDCPDAKKKKKKSVNSLLKFHKLKSGRKGGDANECDLERNTVLRQQEVLFYIKFVLRIPAMTFSSGGM